MVMGPAEELMSAPGDPMNIWGENVRLNMGAYGGTGEASMGPPGWTLLSDLNNDGMVNLVDYALQELDWQKEGVGLAGDLNRDGMVNLADVNLLQLEWLLETVWR